MSALLASVHAIGLLTCFALLGTSRIGACIRWLSFQGILFGLVPIITHDDGLGLRVMLLAGGNIALKGIIFPWILLRLRARTNYNREVEPFVGFVASILFGAYVRWVASYGSVFGNLATIFVLLKENFSKETFSMEIMRVLGLPQVKK